MRIRSEIPSPQNNTMVMNEINVSQSQISPKSINILREKYGKDIKNAISEYSHDLLKYAEISESLEKINYIKDLPNKNELANDIWKMFSIDSMLGVPKNTFVNAILAITNGNQRYNKDSKENSKNSESLISNRPLSKDEKSISEMDINYLRQKYAVKISCTFLSSRRASNPEFSQSANFTFTPHISSRSNELANLLKQKQIYNATQDSNENNSHKHCASIPDMSTINKTSEEYFSINYA